MKHNTAETVIVLKDNTSIEFVLAMLETGNGVDDIPVALWEMDELAGVKS